jgi:hypothetical protein
MRNRIAGTASELPPSTWRRRLPRDRALRLAPARAGRVALSLFASACGSTTGSGVAQIGATQTTTSSSDPSGSRSKAPSPSLKDLVAFAACTRTQGVPNFPDPKADANGYHLMYGPENGIDQRSPQFKSAEQACKKLLPNGGTPSSQEQAKQLQDALKFAQCIRSHGAPNFPDPKLSSHGDLEMDSGSKSSVNPNSPRFKAAETACQHLLPNLRRAQ